MPTVWRTIPVLEFLQESWENMADSDKFYEISDAIRAGTANLNKWYRKTDDTNAYFICLGMFAFVVLIFSDCSITKPLTLTTSLRTSKRNGSSPMSKTLVDSLKML